MNQKDYLWRQIVSFDNLYQSFKQARRGKRSAKVVADFEFYLEEQLIQLRAELREGLYLPGTYQSFTIHEPKRRLISAAPFRDRVVHHALCNIIEPVYERKFIYDSYANRIGKGTHRALDRCTYFLRRFKYVLPLDIRQFFASIDHEKLISIINKTIHEGPVLDLCAKILASGNSIQDETFQIFCFPGDDLFSTFRAHGLPIGNLTSQFWANVYLNGLDHFIKRNLKCSGYIRYVDDMLLFSNDLNVLHDWRHQIQSFLATLRLIIHESSAQPTPTCHGVPFLGFTVFPGHRRLKRRKAIHIRRRLKNALIQVNSGIMGFGEFNASLKGWMVHASHGDTYGLRRSILDDLHILDDGVDEYGSRSIAPFY